MFFITRASEDHDIIPRVLVLVCIFTLHLCVIFNKIAQKTSISE